MGQGTRHDTARHGLSLHVTSVSLLCAVSNSQQQNQGEGTQVRLTIRLPSAWLAVASLRSCRLLTVGAVAVAAVLLVLVFVCGRDFMAPITPHIRFPLFSVRDFASF